MEINQFGSSQPLRTSEFCKYLPVCFTPAVQQVEGLKVKETNRIPAAGFCRLLTLDNVGVMNSVVMSLWGL